MRANPFTSPDVMPGEAIATPPSSRDVFLGRSFRGLTFAFAWLTILLLAYLLWEVGGSAMPAMQRFGLDFLTTTTWDVNQEQFGILPEIWGTLYSSLLALALGGFFGVAIAIYLTQDFLPAALEVIFKNIIELLAAIPSVVYGLWGIFVVIPAIRPVANWIHDTFSWIPFFGTSLSGPGLLPAALVLTIMILPTVSAISRDALGSVHPRIKEAALGLGATRWEAIIKVILPTAAPGIFGALVLGFGRALGETMALAMLVGNSNQLSLSLFSPANTLAALLALNFPEAGKLEEGVLMYAAMVLMGITLVVNILGALMLNRATANLTGGRR
jgi:phosphate transport system permease protein